MRGKILSINIRVFKIYQMYINVKNVQTDQYSLLVYSVRFHCILVRNIETAYTLKWLVTQKKILKNFTHQYKTVFGL